MATANSVINFSTGKGVLAALFMYWSPNSYSLMTSPLPSIGRHLRLMAKRMLRCGR